MKKQRRTGTLGGTIDEIKNGTFVANARVRSSRRKSKWNFLLLLIFPLWLAIWWASVELTWVAYVLLFLRSASAVSPYWMRSMGPGQMSLASFLLMFPLFFATMPLAMVIGNFLIYRIPAARRAMDAEDRAFPGTEYTTGQRELKRLAIMLLPIAIVITLIGAWLKT